MQFIKKLYLSYLNRTRLYEDYSRALQLLTSSELELRTLKEESKRLKNVAELQQEQYRKSVPVGDLDFIDDEPADTEEFTSYASQVGMFHEDIMSRRLRDNIGKTRAQMADTSQVFHTSTRGEYDWYLRGMESAFWAMNEWGNRMSAQRRVYLQDKENNEYADQN